MTFLVPAHSKQKKALGGWGESCLDDWMESQGWCAHKKNHKLYGGEIDRVYKKINDRGAQYFCVAEVKTVTCTTSHQFYSYFTYSGVSRLVKPKQILNLYKYSNHLCAFKRFKQPDMQMHIRFFIVIKVSINEIIKQYLSTQNSFKVCNINSQYVIVSFVPEL